MLINTDEKTIITHFLIVLSLVLFICPFRLYATIYTVSVATDSNPNGGGSGSGNTGDLRYVLNLLNGGTGSGGTAGTVGPDVSNNTINFTTSGLSTLNLAANLPVILNGVVINGPTPAQSISGGGLFRMFATFKASLTLNNLALADGLALGGSGASTSSAGGGGGGLGAGGGVYVDLGQTISLSNTTITTCKAQGGDGGSCLASGGVVSPGGGGASWTIGNKNAITSGVGGGDYFNTGRLGGAASEGASGYGGGAGGAGVNAGGVRAGGAGGGNGPGGNGRTAGGGNGGYCGGGGGGFGNLNAQHGGGGGNGGGNGSGTVPGGGGAGGYGTGGGCTGSPGGGGLGGGGGGGVSVSGGGGGGFGGGGGGGGVNNTSSAIVISRGSGGFYAGSGGNVNSSEPGSGGGSGGGGAGIGGGVFVGDGATLVVANSVNIANNTFVGGAKGAAVGGRLGTDGTGLANDVFLFRSAKIVFTGTQSQNIAFAIEGDPLATTGNLDAGITVNTSSDAVITLTSTGNTYRGGTIINTGTLSAAVANLPPANTITVGSSGTFILTGGTNANVISNSGIFNIPNALTNAATITNSSIMNINAALTTNIGSSINNTVSGTLTLGAAGSIDTTGTLTNAGNYNIGNSFNTANFTNSGALYLVGNGSISGNLTGGTTLNIGRDSNSVINANLSSTGGTIASIPIIQIFSGSSYTVANAISGVTTSFTVDSGATATFNAALTGVSGAFTNNGTTNIGATGSINTTGAFLNNSNITVASGGSIFIGATATNAGSLVLNGSLSGTGTMTNANTLTFNSGASSTALINNNNIFNINGSTNLNGAVTNNATMHIDAVVTGTAVITNTSGATLELATNAAVSNAIHNNAGGIVNITGAGSGIINNAGTLNVLQPLDSIGNINNSGLINLQNIINMAGFTLTNTGTINVIGTQNLDAASFINSGIQNYTITDDIIFDSLTANCPINLSNGTVNVTSTFFGAEGSSFTWDILTGTNIVINANTMINPPSGAMFGSWSSSIIGGKILRISYSHNSGGGNFTPDSTVSAEIAAVLNAMAANVTNSGQAELLSAVNSVSTQAQYDYLLNNLQPNTNTSNINLSMQKIGFDKVDVRVTGVHGNINKFNNKLPKVAGIAAGDLAPNLAIWLSGVGSISKQSTNGENQGYRAKILGAVLGIDFKHKDNNLYGVAVCIANANVYASVNTTNNTRVLSYNIMLYGANDFKNKYFLEWATSGVINKNYGVRVFGINGFDLSTVSSYRGALAGAKFNFGRMVDLNDSLVLSQVNMLQYVLVHQPSYNENNSVAALHISTRNNSSIVTVGSGFRVGIFNDNHWLNGRRELRSMITYDLISPNQATTANFIVGSGAFDMSSVPARLALKLGADCAVKLYKNLDLQFSYDYEVRSGYYNNFGEIKFIYAF